MEIDSSKQIRKNMENIPKVKIKAGLDPVDFKDNVAIEVLVSKTEDKIATTEAITKFAGVVEAPMEDTGGTI